MHSIAELCRTQLDTCGSYVSLQTDCRLLIGRHGHTEFVETARVQYAAHMLHIPGAKAADRHGPAASLSLLLLPAPLVHAASYLPASPWMARQLFCKEPEAWMCRKAARELSSCVRVLVRLIKFRSGPGVQHLCLIIKCLIASFT